LDAADFLPNSAKCTLRLNCSARYGCIVWLVAAARQAAGACRRGPGVARIWKADTARQEGLGGADTGSSSALLDIRIPANAGPPPHIHTREDEVYLIKQGTFQFFMDGICLQAGPGATVYMPKGHMHTFKNIAKHAGEQLLFVYPAGLEQFFREVHDLGLKMPQDFDRLNELSNDKYGINHVPGHDFHAGTCTGVAATGASAK
jgi:mannose-6-phosphate isomerase-like protein (cupin superfamily)